MNLERTFGLDNLSEEYCVRTATSLPVTHLPKKFQIIGYPPPADTAPSVAGLRSA